MASASSTVAMATCLPLLLRDGASAPSHRWLASAWLLRPSRAEVAVEVPTREPKPTKHAARGELIKTTSSTDVSDILSQAVMVSKPQRERSRPSPVISNGRWGGESRGAASSVSKMKVSTGSVGVITGYQVHRRNTLGDRGFDSLTDRRLVLNIVC